VYRSTLGSRAKTKKNQALILKPSMQVQDGIDKMVVEVQVPTLNPQIQ